MLRSASGRALARYPDVLPLSGGATFRLLGRADNGVRDGLYRGSLEIRVASASGLNAINTLGIESYLAGVVPSESPPIWPPEALKAQAVAARTYASATGVGGKGFDQYPDTRSQMYRGFNAETAATNNAVDSTAGEVVTYNGEPVVTYFFSTSGGHTENVENVFTNSDPKPWLKGVDVAWRDEQAVLAMANDFAAAGKIGSDDGAARGSGLDENAWNPFTVVRRQADDVALRDQGRNVVSPSEPFHIAGVMPLPERRHWNGRWMTVIGLTSQHKTGSHSTQA